MSHHSKTSTESSSLSIMADEEDDGTSDDDQGWESDDSLGGERPRASHARLSRDKEHKKDFLDEFGKLLGAQQEEETPKENIMRPIEELGPNRLDMVCAVDVATVLEELSDKLDIISTSIDTPPIDIRRERSIISDTTLHRPELHIPPVLDTRINEFSMDKWILTQSYRSVIPRRLQQHHMEGLENIAGIRKDPTHLLRLHGIKKFTPKGKMQADRTHAQVAVDMAVAELIHNSTFQTFLDNVTQEDCAIQEMASVIHTSVDNAERIVQLKADRKQVRRDKVAELTAMDQAIYMLHDGTQEMRKRKQMESDYVKKFGAMTVKSSQKMCTTSENVVETKLEAMKLAIGEEIRCHDSMDDIIRAKLAKAEDRLEYWMEKYEVDKDDLQNELDTMKANRERDLKRIAWLKATIRDYSQICRDNRRIKNKMAEEERSYRLKTKKAIRLQAWWRGEMVRKELGPFRPVKGGKKKDDDKKGKKKGKKK